MKSNGNQRPKTPKTIETKSRVTKLPAALNKSVCSTRNQVARKKSSRLRIRMNEVVNDSRNDVSSHSRKRSASGKTVKTEARHSSRASSLGSARGDHSGLGGYSQDVSQIKCLNKEV